MLNPGSILASAPLLTAVSQGRPMPGRLDVVAVVLVASAALCVPTAVAEGVCASVGPPEVTGTVANPDLTEISGLAASPAHPGVLWTHNDSGGAPELFAMAEDGADLGAFWVDGAEATDWEDLAIGPGSDPSASYLYAADIGDNNAVRDPVTVYRVAEPAAAPKDGGILTGTATFQLHYPGGPADAEALLVDPVTGDLVVVTKTYVGTARILRAPAASLDDGATVTMTDEGTITLTPPAGSRATAPGMAVTGGDISSDGALIVLRTYQTVLAFVRADGQSVADALRGEPCSAPQLVEPEGEAIAIAADGSAYFTASEGSGVPIARASIDVPAKTTTTATTPTTTNRDPAQGGDEDDTLISLVVGAAVVALGVGVSLVVWARRRRSASAPG